MSIILPSYSLEEFQNGQVLQIDKPLGWTSFQVVKKVRYLICKQFNIKKIKVGHAGTLDPLATGLLLVCTGKKTKEIDQLQAQTKEYIAEITFGATTPSYDLEHPFDHFFNIEHITREYIEQVLPSFIGIIDQIPPLFSALKKGGKPLYKYARANEKIEIKSRKVLIETIEIKSFDLPKLVLKVICGKGTYIRSLAHDLGQRLKSGAHLSRLRRIKISNYSV